MSLWQDVCQALRGGSAILGENHIAGELADCLTEASRTLDCGFPSFCFIPTSLTIIPELLCMGKLKLCGLISVAARRPRSEHNSPTRVAEPLVFLVLLGSLRPSLGLSFHLPLYTVGMEEELHRGALLAPRLCHLGVVPWLWTLHRWIS